MFLETNNYASRQEEKHHFREDEEEGRGGIIIDSLENKVKNLTWVSP